MNHESGCSGSGGILQIVIGIQRSPMNVPGSNCSVQIKERCSGDARKILRRILTANIFKINDPEHDPGKQKERVRRSVRSPALPNYSKQEICSTSHVMDEKMKRGV